MKKLCYLVFFKTHQRHCKTSYCFHQLTLAFGRQLRHPFSINAVIDSISWTVVSHLARLLLGTNIVESFLAVVVAFGVDVGVVGAIDLGDISDCWQIIAGDIVSLDADRVDHVDEGVGLRGGGGGGGGGGSPGNAAGAATGAVRLGSADGDCAFDVEGFDVRSLDELRGGRWEGEEGKREELGKEMIVTVGK